MNFSTFKPSQKAEVIELFVNTFSASEGEAEGRVIGDFVETLLANTAVEDLVGFVAKDGESIVACIFFSRFSVPNGQLSYILSPVAVATDVQGTGIGQALINYGLKILRDQGVELVFTYGDPAFYSKTGFEHISEDIVAAPCPLSMPIGWLAQSLNGEPVPAMKGATACVDALNDPSLW
jgi:predicted N-acetyltransferase YhbS